MGYVEILRDGEWLYCDKCEKPKAKHEGSYIKADGLALIWLCKECK